VANIATAAPAMISVFAENADHVREHAPRSRAELVPSEVAPGYNAPDARVDEESEAIILEWLTAHA
jgi:hypothetical protein